MALYVTRNNEDIYSVVNKTVGDLNNIYSFLLENISVTLNNIPIGIEVNYEIAIFQPPAVNSNAPNSPVVLQKYLSRQNQTIYDVCLMTLTDLNNLYQLNFNNIMTPPLAGSIFNFNPTKITDNILKKYTTDNAVIFATVGKVESFVPPTPETFFRITTNNDIRITSSGDKRIYG